MSRVELYLSVLLAICFCSSISGSWWCIILLTVIALFQSNRKARLAALAKAPLLPALALFSLAMFISGAASGGFNEGLQILRGASGLLVPYLVAYQLFQGLSETNKLLDTASSATTAVIKADLFSNTARWSLTTLLVCAAISGLFGMVQQLFNYHPLTTVRFLQATGFLSEPMSFAGLMQITSFIALGLFLKKGYKHLPLLKSGKTFFLVVCANFIGLCFCGERGAWVGMVFAFLSVCIFVSPKLLLRGLLTLFLVALLGWFFVPLVKTRLSPLTHLQTDSSVQARLKIWTLSWNLFTKNPLTGVGPRKFPRIDMPDQVVPGRSTDLNHAHSNYMQMLSTTGLLGTIAFLYLLGSALYLACRQARATGSGEAAALGLGLLGALISLSVAGFFEYNFGSGMVKLIQWFELALLLPLARSKAAPIKSEPQSRPSIETARQSESLE